MPPDPAAIEAIALLQEPARRALYEWVASAGRAVSRDEAAASVGVSRALAAFHLDRLVREGLLEVEYRRLTGRSGPGAGRPAKLYRRSGREVAVSLPDRRYQISAEVFATAIERMAGSVPPEPLQLAARDVGAAVGKAARRRAGPRPGRRRLREALLVALAEGGYEPRETASGEIRFGNCPFRSLVEDHRDLVCGTNLALAQGMLTGLGDDRATARLDPQPGLCCVAIAPGRASQSNRPPLASPRRDIRPERPG
jgi:predicted ArsR family transcriptional regulator